MVQRIFLWLTIFFLYEINGKAQDVFDRFETELLHQTPANKTFQQKIFSADKFSFGVLGGINFSLPIPFSRNSVFTGTNAELLEKEYALFYQNIGNQAAFEIEYQLNRIITVSLRPGSFSYVYNYSNNYQWTGQNSNTYNADFKHKLKFLEIPVIVGFNTTFSTWQPYYQAGLFYGRILNANTQIDIEETSLGLNGSNQVLNQSTSVNSTDQYVINQFGAIGGIGISYLSGSLKISLEANYRFLFTNLTSFESRFQNNVIVSGSYDVPDDIKMTNLAINLCISVPLVCKDQSGRGKGIFCK